MTELDAIGMVHDKLKAVMNDPVLGQLNICDAGCAREIIQDAVTKIGWMVEEKEEECGEKPMRAPLGCGAYGKV